MSLREIMQRNQLAAAAVAVIVIVISVVWMARGGKSDQPRPEQVYFYDVGAGELFPADRAAQPPIDAPSGDGRGVQAFVYSCGDCAEGSLQIGYVMTYTDRAVEAMKQLATIKQGDAPVNIPVELSQAVESGTLVAVLHASGDLQWVAAHTSQGMAIMRRSSDLCDQGKAKPCFPGP